MAQDEVNECMIKCKINKPTGINDGNWSGDGSEANPKYAKIN